MNKNFMTLEELKSQIIQSVKLNYSVNVIENAYPVYKQLNLIRAGGADLTTMSAFIDGKRSEIEAVESAINALPNQDILTNFTAVNDTKDVDYVGSILESLTTDDQKLYVACALRKFKTV